ncbi:MAG: glycosyltransferase family 4 protein [Myxococcales bacterium]|nr:glycosyltransferase family 4 protein [Myxococcales bacterium]
MMPTRPLAIVAPNVGTPSETFIHRHVEALYPQRTVVISTLRDNSDPNAYPGVPRLDPEAVRAPLRSRLRARIMARLHLPHRPHVQVAVERFILEHGVRVVLAEYLDWGWRWKWLKERTRVRFYAHAHGYDVSMMLRQREWAERYRELAEMDGIIAMSNACASRLCDLGLPADRVHVIPYGVELPPDPGSRPRSQAGQVRCLAVGRMVPKKAPIYLLESFRRAHDRWPGLMLDYYGDGPLLAAAMQFVQASELGGAVTLHRAAPNAQVLDAMSRADIFLQHSVVDPLSGDEEGLPVAILEAMAHGLPVVSTRHAGIPEAVEAGRSGHLVEEEDVEGMATHLESLARDRSAREQMGRRGREIVETRFSWERERKELLSVLGL